jgi:CheY-like chemotaxis protein
MGGELDADRALELLAGAARSSQPYALALLDGDLHGADRYELARAIRARPELGGVRLALLVRGGRTSPDEAASSTA